MGGASNYPVYEAKYKNQNVIIKLCSKREKEMLEKAQNNLYVVELIDSVSMDELNELNEVFKEKTKKMNLQADLDLFYIITEKLDACNLYPTKHIDPMERQKKLSESLMYLTILIDNDETIKISINKDMIQKLIQCTEIVKYFIQQKIYHGDLKQGNMGMDKYGKLKVFDFGLSFSYKEINEKLGQYDMSPSRNEILVLGKLFVNILTNLDVFAEGRHYTSDRLPLKQDDIYKIIGKLVIDENLKDLIKKLCYIPTPSDDAVKLLYYYVEKEEELLNEVIIYLREKLVELKK